jgi:hypothetical protein
MQSSPVQYIGFGANNPLATALAEVTGGVLSSYAQHVVDVFNSLDAAFDGRPPVTKSDESPQRAHLQLVTNEPEESLALNEVHAPTNIIPLFGARR